MGNGSRSICKWKKLERHNFKKNTPALPYSIGISSIARITHPYSGARCGQSPRKAFLPLMPILYAKNSKNMYRIYGIGNTIIRKEIRQHESDDIRQQIYTYLIHIRKDYFP